MKTLSKERIEEFAFTLSREQIDTEIINSKVKVKYRDVDLVREVCKLYKVRRLFALCEQAGVPYWDVKSGRDLNPLQLRILQWIRFYVNVDGSYERPPDRIIYNDRLLNKWLESQAKETRERYEENWRKERQGGVQKSAMDHQEIFEFENYEDYDDEDFI
jgi:hypothetical protein